MAAIIVLALAVRSCGGHVGVLWQVRKVGVAVNAAVTVMVMTAPGGLKLLVQPLFPGSPCT